jgi:hypothetical protein
MHTHRVDLSQSEGACVVENELAQGRRLRYFDLRPLVGYLRSLDKASTAEANEGLTRQMASLIERGGISRSRQRTHRFGCVWAAAGMDRIMAALADPVASGERPALDPWMLRDESTEGMGFALSEDLALPHGCLVAVSWDPSGNVWQLLAIRWSSEDNGQSLVGTQSLSRHPKRVEVYSETGTPGGAPEKTWALFLPMTHAEQGVGNLLLPKSHYRQGAPMMLRDGDVVYRLRLGEVQEGHEDWLRVGMDVLGREQFVAAA